MNFFTPMKAKEKTKSPETLKKLFIQNWRSKLICLLLAVAVWAWVEWRYVKDENTEWDMNDIRFAIPE